jgi:uncharacterized protein YaaW (UPF0174 family)
LSNLNKNNKGKTVLNGDLKKEALSRLNDSIKGYEDWFEKTQNVATDLFILRKRSSEEVIDSVETYINKLANRPKEFDRSFAEYKAEFQVFTGMLNELKSQSDRVNSQFEATVAAGALAGVGVATMAPTAAMAIATTFGTASTGTAISSLSGAVATRAALAWLGGGALTAGGGGVVAGEALLVLAGPIGWTIGGLSLVGAGIMARKQNEKIAKRANEERKKLETKSTQLKSANHEIKNLITLTKNHISGMKSILETLSSNAPKNYNNFSPYEKNQIAALINHIYSLSTLLNKKILS